MLRVPATDFLRRQVERLMNRQKYFSLRARNNAELPALPSNCKEDICLWILLHYTLQVKQDI